MTENKKKKFNGEGKQLDGENPTDIYNMVLKEVELPLLEIVMKQCDDNQSKASKILGINRGTLRTKLKEHNLL